MFLDGPLGQTESAEPVWFNSRKPSGDTEAQAQKKTNFVIELTVIFL